MRFCTVKITRNYAELNFAKTRLYTQIPLFNNELIKKLSLQEIDGKSLLLMKRSDVLTGLSLKLGPALKIYTHIQRLQTMGHSSYR